MSDDYEAIRSRLEDISEQLADLAMNKLRDTLENGDPDGAAAERRLTRARRAVEKAAHLLRE